MNDKEKTIGAIVTYPEKGEKHSNFSGIAGYTKNLLLGLGNDQRNEIVVFSNIKNGVKAFVDEGIEVNECWHRGSLGFVKELMLEIKKYPKLKTIHLQHEFNLFGQSASILFFLLLLRRLHDSGIKVVVTFHGIVSQRDINQQFNQISQLSLPVFLVKYLFKFVFVSGARFIDKVIVHEEYFKRVLVDEYGYREETVKVIFHGVEELKLQDTQEEARKELKIGSDKKVLLFFGFLAGYKGVNLLLDAFEKLDKAEYVLIIAGGKPKRVENDMKYIEWYNRIEDRIKIIPNIIRVGFVPDDLVSLYFNAADVLILPYLFMLSASGPMSFAIGYRKPFLASDAFREVLSKELIFKREPSDLLQKVEEFFENKEIVGNIIENMKEQRLWEKVGNETYKLIQE